MKFRLITLLVVLGLVAGLFGMPQPVKAASYGTPFISSVVYMNVGSDVAFVSFNFYAEGSSTAVTYPASGTLQVPLHGAGSLYAGDVFSSSFKGSVAISSSQPLAVTGVQTPPAGNAVKTRMLSNGFTAGSANMTIQSVRKTSAQYSVFSVQNADSVANDVTVKFFLPGNNTPVATDVISNLPAGAAKYYDLGKAFTTTSGSIPATFDGSATVSAVQTGSSNAGAVVASSSEYDIASTAYKAYAFNGVSAGASKVFMPSAFCNYNQGRAGIGPIDTYYALTNTSDQPVNITVSYSDVAGTHLYDENFTNIAPGNKAVSNGCAAPLPNTKTPYSGSATVTVTWTGTAGTGSPSVVSVGKVAGYGYSSAFEGVPDPAPNSVALPYVRYSSDYRWTNGTRQRVFLSIQNVGDTQWDSTNKVTVTFYDDAGNVKGTLDNGATVVKPGQKINFDASSLDANFGYWATSVGGGAVVKAPTGGRVAALARAVTYESTTGFQWSEDYIGIPLQ